MQRIGHSVAMSVEAGNYRDSRVAMRVGRAHQSSDRLAGLSHLRRLRECEQVAAVCYRLRGGDIEFLLVRTRGSGRWTFPKGSAERGLTHAQAAALEAYEEAGVHGRIEEFSFTRYFRRERDEGGKSQARYGKHPLAVSAHLCEVRRLGPAQESGRNRTWFTALDARLRLQQGRTSRAAAEFTRVVDKAVERIHWLCTGDTVNRTEPRQDSARRALLSPDLLKPDFHNPGLHKDGLQKVRFDFADAYGRESSFEAYARQVAGMRRLAVPAADLRPRAVLQAEVLQFSLPREKKGGIPGVGRTNI